MITFPDDNSTQLLSPDLLYFDSVARAGQDSGRNRRCFSQRRGRLLQRRRAAHPRTVPGSSGTGDHHHLSARHPDRTWPRPTNRSRLTEGNSTVTSVGLEFDKAEGHSEAALPGKGPLCPTEASSLRDLLSATARLNSLAWALCWPTVSGVRITLPVSAERADRDKPVNLEADRVDLDDAKKEGYLSATFTLTQGTLLIKADKIIVNRMPRDSSMASPMASRPIFARSARVSTNTSKAFPSASNTTARPTKCRCSRTHASSAAATKSG